MQKQTRYTVTKSMAQVFDHLGVSRERVLRRAGLPDDILNQDMCTLSGPQLFAFWDALHDVADRPGLPMEMARTFARGPFVPALFAFSCSPNIVIGLQRLSVFKPLVAPVKLIVEQTDTRVSLELVVREPGLEFSANIAAFEMVYFVEICRIHTGVDILPLQVGVPGFMPDQEAYDRYFGRPAILHPRPRLVLSREDALRPLISENPELWAGFERELTRQLAEQRRNTPVVVRVRNALLELLPAGQASVDAVCARLLMSRRSLQRHLKSEGETFQRVLDSTREDLSMHYLKRGDMSVEEISYLLAYRDPNSFYRAFHAWTGLTPAQARGTAVA